MEDEKIRMTCMQTQIDFKMRPESDNILSPIDYITLRTKHLVISVPIGNDETVLITAEPVADDKKIIKIT